MAEVHVNTIPSTSIIFHQPGQHPLPVGAGQPVSQNKDVSGKVIKTSGTVAGVTHNNPA